jgi:hypothetical protein
LLVAKDKSDVNFPVDFVFEFGRTYLISNSSSGYKLEVLE